MCVPSAALKAWMCEQTLLCSCLPTFLSDSCLICLFQIWRLVTATFYFPTGFLYLVNLYFLYHYSSRLETGEPVGLSGFYTHSFSHTHWCSLCQCWSLSWYFPPGLFDGRPADYVFMLIFNWICVVVSFFKWHHKIQSPTVNHSLSIYGYILVCLFSSPPLIPALGCFLCPSVSLFHLSFLHLALSLSAVLCHVRVALCQWPSVSLPLQSRET